MLNILSAISNFIKLNWIGISIVILLFSITSLTIILYKIQLRRIKASVKRKYIIENLTNNENNLMLKINKHDCSGKNYSKICNDAGILDNEPSKHSCNINKCCVWVKNKNNNNCIPGDNSGPYVLNDKNNIPYTEYYYDNKHYKINN